MTQWPPNRAVDPGQCYNASKYGIHWRGVWTAGSSGQINRGTAPVADRAVRESGR